MQWWNDFLDWIRSDAGWKIISTAIIPFVAIVVAGIIGAAIGRGSTRRLIAQRDHELRASAVAALVAAGQGAATWHSQGPAVKEHSELLASQADVAVRLLPIAGAGMAADWANHELRDMRTNSVSYSYQAEQSLDEYRDRLVEWLHHPNRAKRLFGGDLDRWDYSDSGPDPLLLEQQRWAEEQYSANNVQPAAAPAATPDPAAHSDVAPLTAPIPTVSAIVIPTEKVSS